MMKPLVRVSIIVLLFVVSGKLCFAAPQLPGETEQPADYDMAAGPNAMRCGSMLHDTVSTNNTTAASNGDVKYNLAVDRLRQQALMLKKYATENNYSTDYCFLVDMSVPSGKNRFFVYNFKKDDFEVASMVSHGHGSFKWDKPDQLEFSNEPWSLKTSVGKYKVGTSYEGRYGLAFKLHGLDKTNSNAYDRAIVMHAYKDMPDKEVYPKPLMESLGCPAVSTSFLSELNSKYIKPSCKPILMWIYN